MFKGTWSASSQHWVSRQLLFTTADTHALLHTCAQLSVRALGDQNVLPCVLFLIETLSPSTSANIKKKLPEDLFLSLVPSHKAPYLWETLRFPFKKLSRLYFPQLCLSSWQTRKFSPASPRAESCNHCFCGGSPRHFHVYVVRSLSLGGSPASWQ